MSEELQRNQSLEPLHELTTNLVHEMGEQPEQRINWLMNQSGESFGRLVLDVNSTARGVVAEEHRFDGEGVQAGTVSGSIPPDQEDKIILLGELVQGSQAHARKRLEQGADAQTVMTELAVAIPTVVNKLHLFADGNGRTSRILRMVLRDGDQITPDKIDALVNKTGFEKYDTTPATPVERAIMRAMRKENETEGYSVVYDVIDDDFMEDAYAPDGLGDLFEEQIPGIDTRIVKAYRDLFNFGETVRLLAKEKGLGEKVSLKTVLEATTNPDELSKFIEVYRGVRKQRVELLIQGLLDEKELPLPEDEEGREVNGWINNARKRTGLSVIDPTAIRTVQDFQVAYEEAFSPHRTQIAQ